MARCPGPRHGSTAEARAWPPSASAGLAAAGPDGTSDSQRGRDPVLAYLGPVHLGPVAQAPADSRQEPQADAEPDETPGGRAEAADRRADPASRGSITDTMAAELAWMGRR